jgi:IPT/TIG domain
VFAYIPVVTSIAPATGSDAGGTPVTITGTGFTPAATVTPGKLHLDDRPIALTAAVTARPDRTQLTSVGLPDQPEPIQQLSPQHDPSRPGHRILTRHHHRASNSRHRPRHDYVIELKTQRSNVHQSGAPRSGQMRTSQSTSSQPEEHLSRQSEPFPSARLQYQGLISLRAGAGWTGRLTCAGAC